MKRTFLTTLLLSGIIAGFSLAPVRAESTGFWLPLDLKLNGVTLEKGKYEVELNGDDQATILRKGRKVVSAAVERQPLGNRQPNSVASISGEITEIRLKDEVLVFVNSKLLE